jgi:hypothetical protein
MLRFAWILILHTPSALPVRILRELVFRCWSGVLTRGEIESKTLKRAHVRQDKAVSRNTKALL